MSNPSPSLRDVLREVIREVLDHECDGYDLVRPTDCIAVAEKIAARLEPIVEALCAEAADRQAQAIGSIIVDGAAKRLAEDEKEPDDEDDDV